MRHILFVRIPVVLILVSLVVGRLFSAPSPAKSSVLRFDMGTATSPVAEGYTRIDEKTLYTPDRGYGWLGTNYQSADVTREMLDRMPGWGTTSTPASSRGTLSP